MTLSSDDRLRRRFHYAAEFESVARAREDACEFVTELLSVLDIEPELPAGPTVELLRLVVSELCSNAVEAAPGRWFEVEISVDTNGDGGDQRDGQPRRVTCSVVNPDEDIAADDIHFGSLPDPMAKRGRGLVIVDAVADRTWVDRVDDTIVVGAEMTLSS